MNDQDIMEIALQQAHLSAEAGEVPVGSVAVKDKQIIAVAHNRPISACDPTAHAEIEVIRKAASHLGAYRIPGVEIFVTLEPCLMCFGAMLHARISRLVFGASDPKVGFSRTFDLIRDDGFFNHSIEIEGGVFSDECSDILREFFRKRR